MEHIGKLSEGQRINAMNKGTEVLVRLLQQT